MSNLEDEKKDLEKRIDEAIANRMEPIIKEGQQLEKKIKDKEGSTVRKEIRFEAADITLVAAGEKVESKVLSVIQEL